MFSRDELIALSSPVVINEHSTKCLFTGTPSTAFGLHLRHSAKQTQKHAPCAQALAAGQGQHDGRHCAAHRVAPFDAVCRPHCLHTALRCLAIPAALLCHPLHITRSVTSVSNVVRVHYWQVISIPRQVQPGAVFLLVSSLLSLLPCKIWMDRNISRCSSKASI